MTTPQPSPDGIFQWMPAGAEDFSDRDENEQDCMVCFVPGLRRRRSPTSQKPLPLGEGERAWVIEQECVWAIHNVRVAQTPEEERRQLVHWAQVSTPPQILCAQSIDLGYRRIIARCSS
jgi:hypothetical protein